jgi:hypothetical protein
MDLLKIFKKSKSKNEDNEYLNVSYSQEGEDRILARLFENKQDGFYIDVGAHHPFRFSNTYLFYKRGWKGINVDANPGSKLVFDLHRPKDINVEVGISDKEIILEFFSFKESALNTFSPSLANSYIDAGWELKEKTKINTISLLQLFEKYIINGIIIDFLTMDIEGFELEALMSNDWQKFRPKLLLIEILDFELDDHQTHPISVFLKSKGYSIFAKTKNTVFFKDNLLK